MILAVTNATYATAYIEAWKIQDFKGASTCDLAIPVRRSNQLSYEATDIGSWSFVGSNEPFGFIQFELSHNLHLPTGRPLCNTKLIHYPWIKGQKLWELGLLHWNYWDLKRTSKEWAMWGGVILVGSEQLSHSVTLQLCKHSLDSILDRNNSKQSWIISLEIMKMKCYRGLEIKEKFHFCNWIPKFSRNLATFGRRIFALHFPISG